MKTLQALIILLAISAFPLMSQEKNKAEYPKIATLKTVKTGEPILATPFEYSGQVTASVYLDGFNYENEEYCLYSIVNSEIRGTSRGMYFSPSGQWVHTHMMYSNQVEGDTISFQLYDKESNKWYKFEEKLVFKSDMIIENAIHPFILKNSRLLEPSDLSLEPSLDVFPNPTGGQATILYSLINEQAVLIQVVDKAGRVVRELDLGTQPAGKHQASWDTADLNHGSYIIRIKNQPGVSKRLIIAK